MPDLFANLSKYAQQAAPTEIGLSDKKKYSWSDIKNPYLNNPKSATKIPDVSQGQETGQKSQVVEGRSSLPKQNLRKLSQELPILNEELSRLLLQADRAAAVQHQSLFEGKKLLDNIRKKPNLGDLTDHQSGSQSSISGAHKGAQDNGGKEEIFEPLLDQQAVESKIRALDDKIKTMRDQLGSKRSFPDSEDHEEKQEEAGKQLDNLEKLIEELKEKQNLQNSALSDLQSLMSQLQVSFQMSAIPALQPQPSSQMILHLEPRKAKRKERKEKRPSGQPSKESLKDVLARDGRLLVIHLSMRLEELTKELLEKELNLRRADSQLRRSKNLAQALSQAQSSPESSLLKSLTLPPAEDDPEDQTLISQIARIDQTLHDFETQLDKNLHHGDGSGDGQPAFDPQRQDRIVKKLSDNVDHVRDLLEDRVASLKEKEAELERSNNEVASIQNKIFESLSSQLKSQKESSLNGSAEKKGGQSILATALPQSTIQDQTLAMTQDRPVDNSELLIPPSQNDTITFPSMRHTIIQTVHGEDLLRDQIADLEAQIAKLQNELAASERRGAEQIERYENYIQELRDRFRDETDKPDLDQQQSPPNSPRKEDLQDKLRGKKMVDPRLRSKAYAIEQRCAGKGSANAEHEQ